MPTVTFITADGEKSVIENAEGSLMDIAVDNDIEGIDGACGGVCSCATCHVKVPAEWRQRVGSATEAEKDIFEFEDEADESSRLGCQVELTSELDGLTVHVVGL